MSKPAAQRDGVTVVIPAHNAADALDQVLDLFRKRLLAEVPN